MKELKIKRIIAVGGAGILKVSENKLLRETENFP
jgi:putative NADH-flavin reductase